jgi:phage shock protein PspC (stress-responsive transcriptional regulator)
MRIIFHYLAANYLDIAAVTVLILFVLAFVSGCICFASPL